MVNRTTVLILSLALLVPTVSLSGQGEVGGPRTFDNHLQAVASVKCGGLTCTFDGTRSTAPPDANFQWDFGDGKNGNGDIANHTYSNAGVYIATLTVSDGENESTAQVAHRAHPFGFDLDGDNALDGWSFSAIDHEGGLLSGEQENLWKLIDPASACDLAPAPVGTQVLAFTDEDCDYNDDIVGLENYWAAGRITTPVIDLSQITGLESPELWFATTWDLAPCGDPPECLEPIAVAGEMIYSGDREPRLFVQLSTDGTDWTPVFDNQDYEDPLSEDWRLVRVPLTDHLEEDELQIRFVFDNVYDRAETGHFGWFIDRIRIDDAAAVAPVADASLSENLVHIPSDGTSGNILLDGSLSVTQGERPVYDWTNDGASILGDSSGIGSLPPGVNPVILEITDETNTTATDEIEIRVNRAPDADTTGSDTLVHIPSDASSGSVVLDASSSIDPDDDDLLSYTWALETDPTDPILEDEQGTVFLTAGTHTLVLAVEDEYGATGESSLGVRVNREPIANATESETLVHVASDESEGEVSLNATASSDPDEDDLEYAWFLQSDLEDPILQEQQGTVSLPIGVWTLVLNVTDEHGASNLTTIDIRVNQAPIADTTGTEVLVKVPADAIGGEVALNATQSLDPDKDDLVAFEWLLDGETNATGAQTSTFLEVGIHTLALRVTDEYGAIGETEVEIEVTWPFREDFSDDPFGDGGWTAPDEPTNLWRILGSTECTTSATGTPMLAFNEDDCDYDTGGRVLGDAISPSIPLDFEDLETVNLTLVQRREVETTTREVDVMQLFISTDGGSSWDLLRQWDGRDGDSDGWESVDISLDPYIGEDDVRFRFHFDSKNRFSNDFLGWVVDEIRIG